MSHLRADMRHALRGLRNHVPFTVVVVFTLALGIGANTAIFSFVYGILLRPFPYPEPQQLVRVFSLLGKEAGRESGSSLLDVEDWNRTGRGIAAAGAYTDFDADIRGEGPAQAVRLCQLNASTFTALGVTPALGRLFLPDEDRPGGDVHKALISYGLWQSRFGGDPAVLGKTVRLSLTTLTIVGVMPPGFGFPNRTEVWTPMESWYAIQVGRRREKPRNHRFYSVVARVRPGSSVAAAEQELNAAASALESQHPGTNAGIRVRLRPLREAETGEIRPYLVMVAGAAGFVLLICCFNVAGLMLSRALGARRDYAIRAALGASRTRLLQGALTESGLLALGGALVGVALAYAGVRALLSLIPTALPVWMRIEVDAPALGFALLATVASALLIGCGAAFFASRADVGLTLKDASRGSTGGGARLRSALVVSQVSLTLLLLIGAGLLSRTFLALRNQATGFRSGDLVVARATNYRSGTRVERAVALSQFHEQVLERLRALPGVISAGGTNGMPYTRSSPERSRAQLRIRGVGKEDTKLQLPMSGADVSPGYLETMGIPLLKGRPIDARDTAASPMTVWVSQRTADALWPGRDSIGEELYWGIDEPSSENPYCRVAGIVGNVRHRAGEPDDGLELYYPYTQYPISSIYYVVRTHDDPKTTLPAVRRTIGEVDRDAAIVFVKTMDGMIDESLWQRRLWGVLLSAFGALSLTLVAVGLYGLLSHLVGQRTREIGVRMALGAQPSRIRAQVLGYGARLLLIGLALGLLAGLGLRALLANLVFGVSAADPGNLLLAAAVLATTAMLACYLPARRACAVDPIVALRDQ